MLTPRELEVLDVVGEVMQERLQEVRKEYEGKLTDLQTKVAALEARPVSHVTADTLQGFITDCDKAVERRIAGLPPPPEPVDLTPLTERLASLEGRVPEVTVEKLRAMGDDLEEVIERRFAMLPPPPDLTPINEKLLCGTINPRLRPCCRWRRRRSPRARRTSSDGWNRRSTWWCWRRRSDLRHCRRQRTRPT